MSPVYSSPKLTAIDCPLKVNCILCWHCTKHPYICHACVLLFYSLTQSLVLSRTAIFVLCIWALCIQFQTLLSLCIYRSGLYILQGLVNYLNLFKSCLDHDSFEPYDLSYWTNFCSKKEKKKLLRTKLMALFKFGLGFILLYSDLIASYFKVLTAADNLS